MPIPYSMFALALVMTAGSLTQKGWWWLALWPAVNFALLGWAHLGQNAGIYGKRADGTLPVWSWAVFLPLHLLTRVVWRLVCVHNRAPACQQVLPDLSIGRRLLNHECQTRFDNYVDLTAEFTESSAIRRSPGYILVAILDGAAIDPNILRQAIDQLRPGTTFIHCAQGFGRTGLFSAAVLLRRGLVRDPAEALARLRAVRPGIRLSPLQQRSLEQFACLISESAATTSAVN
ncbi:MAG: hypothetical protein JSS02_06790 [Planctomycetes bacterium]|nr:hypothetical protein [Planctomycetota bacterium]